MCFRSTTRKKSGRKCLLELLKELASSHPICDIKKGLPFGKPFFNQIRPKSNSCYVSCFWALLALADFELHRLAFTQGLEATAVDVAVMNKSVLTAFIQSDEAVALFFVKPLNFA